MLCRLTLETVTPSSPIGRRLPTGVSIPVEPTCHVTDSRTVIASRSSFHLRAIPHSIARWSEEPMSRRRISSPTLMTTPSQSQSGCDASRCFLNALTSIASPMPKPTVFIRAKSSIWNPFASNQSALSSTVNTRSASLQNKTSQGRKMSPRFAVIDGSSCFSEPVVALRQFANFFLLVSLIRFSTLRGISTSPRTYTLVTLAGTFFSCRGIDMIVFALTVTSSPTSLSPRVEALTSSPS